MILGVVGTGVSWPQDPGEHLSPAASEQRVEPEAALVVAGCLVLLGVDGDRCRVEVEDHTRRGGPRLPRPTTSHSACMTDQIDLRLADREQHPPRRGN